MAGVAEGTDAAEGATVTVRVQRGDFDAGAEIAGLRHAPAGFRGSGGIGAIACFIGVARDFSHGSAVKSLSTIRG